MTEPSDELHDRPDWVMLCVVDKSEELSQALRFTCRRAKRTGVRVGLLAVIEPVEFQHWMAVGDIMREERRQEVEQMLQMLSSVVQKRTGHTPILYIREGHVAEELTKLIDEERNIRLLVLGANPGPDGPGPLVSYFVQKMAGRLRVPVVVVPGALTDEQIDSIT